MTKSELDAAVASLSRIGGVYDYVALYVKTVNEPHVRDCND